MKHARGLRIKAGWRSGLVRIVFAALGGLLISVLVAWYAAWTVNFWDLPVRVPARIVIHAPTHHNDTTIHTWVWQSRSVMATLVRLPHQQEPSFRAPLVHAPLIERGMLEWSTVRRGFRDVPFGDLSIIKSELAAGWPFRCLSWRKRMPDFLDFRQLHAANHIEALTNAGLSPFTPLPPLIDFGLVVPGQSLFFNRGLDRTARGGHSLLDNHRILPLRVQWLGLSMNSLVYGIAMYLGYSGVLGLWRRHRRSMGCCVKCGYVLHGLTCDHCPECGTSVPSSTSPPPQSRLPLHLRE